MPKHFTNRYPQALKLPSDQLQTVRPPGLYLCPIRSSINESIAQSIPVKNVEEAKQILVDVFSRFGKEPFYISELHVTSYCFDRRIDSFTYKICADRFFKEKYDYPQIVGWYEHQLD